jgi:hypothetical protein
MTLFGQTIPTVPPYTPPSWSPSGHTTGISGEWADPHSWSYLVQVIGIPMFVLLLFVLITTVLAFFFLKWTVGGNGWVKDIFGTVRDRLIKFLDNLEQANVTNQTTQEAQLALCREMQAKHELGGPHDNTALREAGLSAAEALRSVGHAVKAEGIDQHVDAIKDCLYCRQCPTARDSE